MKKYFNSLTVAQRIKVVCWPLSLAGVILFADSDCVLITIATVVLFLISCRSLHGIPLPDDEM